MQYKIIVDKQPSSNPSDEKKEYIIDIEELRVKGDVYDSLNIEMDRTYVTRRLSLSEYGVLSVLDEPVIENLDEVNIELFEGDNYIYLSDMQGNNFYAEYLIKNDFNNIYATKNEMNSAITQTAQSIELSVNQKLTSYATTEDLEKQVTELNSTITQTASEINLEVSKKVGDDEIISRINQSAEEIQINADKIDISGKAVNFETEISQTVGPYSESDITKTINYIMGTGSLTSQEIDKYDINKDGKIDSADVVLMRRIVNNGGYYIFKGVFKIDPYSHTQTLVLNNTSESSEASEFIFSLLKNYIRYLYTEGINVKGQLIVENDFGQMFTQENEGAFELFIDGNVSCNKLTQTSLESIKKNISKFDKNATDIINNSDIYEYNLKSDSNEDKKLIGFVIGDNYKTPDEVIDKDGQAVELYSAIGILWKGFQEQQAKIEKLEEKILQLEKEVQHE